jgi:prepilin-type processing-associated H-X9-DG protein
MSGTRATLRNTGWPINFKGTGSTTPPFLSEAGEDQSMTPAVRAAAARVVGGFSSGHPGGANFLFGDGSVRFVLDSVAPAVYRRLGARADGELVGSDEY